MPSNLLPPSKPTAVSKIDIGDFTEEYTLNSGGSKKLPANAINMSDSNVAGGYSPSLGDALEFDGVDERLQAEPPAYWKGQTFPITINAWVNIPNTGSPNTIISDRNGANASLAMRIQGSGLPRIRVNNINAEGITNIENTGWRMLTGVWKGSGLTDLEIYVDGTLEASAQGFVGPLNKSGPVMVGAGRNAGWTGYPGSWNNFFDGKMQGIKVWRQRVLAQNEIDKLFSEKK
jgi:hypothetical protein